MVLFVMVVRNLSANHKMHHAIYNLVYDVTSSERQHAKFA